MIKPEDAFATIARLGSDSMSGVYVQPPADEGAIRRMQESASRDLGEPVPEEYAALLRLTNALQIIGAYFKSAENLVPENLDVPQPDVIVLGNDGNMAEFVFDRRDRRFHVINMGFPNERFSSFDSFAEMLARILQEQQVM